MSAMITVVLVEILFFLMYYVGQHCCSVVFEISLMFCTMSVAKTNDWNEQHFLPVALHLSAGRKSYITSRTCQQYWTHSEMYSFNNSSTQ